MQIAAPLNQVTSASDTPKNPYWAWLRVTMPGIHTVAEAAYPVSAMPVITPDARTTRRRTWPSSMSQAVNHHNKIEPAKLTRRNPAVPAPLPSTLRAAPTSPR
jgi:hypothetical protein